MPVVTDWLQWHQGKPEAVNLSQTKVVYGTVLRKKLVKISKCKISYE